MATTTTTRLWAPGRRCRPTPGGWMPPTCRGACHGAIRVGGRVGARRRACTRQAPRGRVRESEAPVGAQGQGTALIRAAENGHAEAVRLLLDKGAAVDARKEVVDGAKRMPVDGAKRMFPSVLYYACPAHPSESTSPPPHPPCLP